MKKELFFAIPIASALFLITACDNKANVSENSAAASYHKEASLGVISASVDDTSMQTLEYSSDTVDVSTAVQSIESDFNEIVSMGTYSCVDFSKMLNMVSNDIGDMYVLKRSDGDKTISQSEAYDNFVKSVKELFPDSEFANDKKYYCFESNEIFSRSDENGKLVYPCVYDSDNLQKIKNNEVQLQFFLYDTQNYGEMHKDKDEYLWYFPDMSGVAMKRAKVMRKADKTHILASWMPIYTYDDVAYVTPDDETKFPLEDGELAVNKAVDQCEDYFRNSSVYIRDKSTYGLKVHKVRILVIDENTKAFRMLLTDSYNGVPFDNMNRQGLTSSFSDGKNYHFNSSEALMARSGEIELCYMTRLNPQLTPISDKVQKIIPFKRAAEMVAESLSDYVTFKASEAALVYTMEFTGAGGDECRPRWRFTLLNENDDRHYIYYVDAVDGYMFNYSY